MGLELLLAACAALASWLAYDRRRLARAAAALREENARVQREKDAVEAVLNTTIDPAVAKLIVGNKVHPEKRTLSVLFADLADFTTSSENTPPETTIDQLNQLFSALEPAIRRFRGHLDKFLGDGLMAEFGVPRTTHHHPLTAVLTGLSMQKRLRVYGFPWRMRIGIASGVSFVGLMGSDKRRSYTAIGDTVNLASRLQTICPVGSVCVDETIYQASHRWLTARRIHAGLPPEAVRKLEGELDVLRKLIEEKPLAKDCLKAAHIAMDLGDLRLALKYHKMALDFDPKHRQPVEQAVSSLLSTEERALLEIKGKKERVAVYEVTGLKDFLSRDRVPAVVRNTYHWLASEIPLPEEWVLSIEAIEGRLGHAQVTAAVSGAVAAAMGLDHRKVKTAFLAGYLNDVGKQNVPEHLLCYEGRLTDLPVSDRDLIESHAAEAESVLREFNLHMEPEVLRAIRQHHERMDGKGYPDGLEGGEIDLLARIIRVADTYEAITAWRSYQDALTKEAALLEVCKDISGGAIDPEVGKTFLDVMGNG